VIPRTPHISRTSVVKERTLQTSDLRRQH
jgi:hypothetical protein